MKAVQVLLRVLLLPFALTAVATAADEAPPQGWRVYQSTAGGYQVLLPGGNVEELKPDDALQAGAPTKLHMVAIVSEGVLYKIVDIDLPPKEVPAAGAEYDLLKRVSQIRARKPGMTLKDERKFESSEMPGIAFTIENSVDNKSEVVVEAWRSYLVGRKRICLMQAALLRENYPSADVDRFLNSFKRWEPPAAVKAELAAETAAQAKWATFTSKAGNFSVSLPGSPEASTVNATLGGSPVAMSLVRVAFAPDRQYAVRYADLPATSIAVRDPKQGLDQARDALLKEVGGKVVTERRAGLGRYAGRHVEAVGTGKVARGGTPLPEGTRMQVRFVFVKNRLFEVIRTVPKGDADDGATFFDSFKTKL